MEKSLVVKMPEELRTAFKVACAKENKKMREVIIELIREWIVEQENKGETK